MISASTPAVFANISAPVSLDTDDNTLQCPNPEGALCATCTNVFGITQKECEENCYSFEEPNEPFSLCAACLTTACASVQEDDESAWCKTCKKWLCYNCSRNDVDQCRACHPLAAGTRPLSIAHRLHHRGIDLNFAPYENFDTGHIQSVNPTGQICNVCRTDAACCIEYKDGMKIRQECRANNTKEHFTICGDCLWTFCSAQLTKNSPGGACVDCSSWVCSSCTKEDPMCCRPCWDIRVAAKASASNKTKKRAAPEASVSAKPTKLAKVGGEDDEEME